MATKRIQDLENVEEVLADSIIPVGEATKTKSMLVSQLKNWLSSFFVSKTGDEDIAGKKTFTGGVEIRGDNFHLSTPYNTGDELGQIDFIGNETYPEKFYIDRYRNSIRLFGGASGLSVDQTFSNAILTNRSFYQSGENGAVYLGNGLKIQWGYATKDSTVTFKYPFSNRPAVLVAPTGSINETKSISVINVTTTSFQPKNSGGWGMHWVAIGI